jgi:hypothetical protein
MLSIPSRCRKRMNSLFMFIAFCSAWPSMTSAASAGIIPTMEWTLTGTA